jgi:16S rRNA (cytosine967-C5)-methyltransferase
MGNKPNRAAARQGDAARAAAVRLLVAVCEDGATLDEAQGRAGLGGLAPPDRARAQRLAAATLRHLGRADAALAPHLSRRPRGAALALLRMATHEMLGEGAAPHGVVDAAVQIAGESRATRPFKGLVNAVLRRVSETGDGPWNAAGPRALPPWLRQPLRKAYGAPAVAAIEAAHERGAPLDLTPRAAEDAPALAAELGAACLPTGSLRLARAGQVSALPGYAEGRFWVQDAAAALPVRLLAPRPGERALDLCAAPGGKTLQLAAAGADVTAVDLAPERLRKVAENLARTGLPARLVAGDARSFEAEPFDLVLVDAPCSATGTIRRHPDLPFAKSGRGLEALAALQAELVDRAVALTRPGGRICLCTCSLLPAEGEALLANALARHPGVSTRVFTPPPGLPAEAVAGPGALRLRPDFWPDRGGMDGFFIALLDRH